MLRLLLYSALVNLLVHARPDPPKVIELPDRIEAGKDVEVKLLVPGLRYEEETYTDWRLYLGLTDPSDSTSGICYLTQRLAPDQTTVSINIPKDLGRAGKDYRVYLHMFYWSFRDGDKPSVQIPSQDIELTSTTTQEPLVYARQFRSDYSTNRPLPGREPQNCVPCSSMNCERECIKENPLPTPESFKGRVTEGYCECMLNCPGATAEWGLYPRGVYQEDNICHDFLGSRVNATSSSTPSSTISTSQDTSTSLTRSSDSALEATASNTSASASTALASTSSSAAIAPQLQCNRYYALALLGYVCI